MSDSHILTFFILPLNILFFGNRRKYLEILVVVSHANELNNLSKARDFIFRQILIYIIAKIYFLYSLYKYLH